MAGRGVAWYRLDGMLHLGQPMTFGALVHYLRLQRGWTQEQLARLAGITVGSVSNLERGVSVLPNADTVERMAAAFDLTPEEMDARWLADRVIRQAQSLARRQAIKFVLDLSDRDVQVALVNLAQKAKRKRPPKPPNRRRR